MSKRAIINLWVEAILQGTKTVNDIPEKLKDEIIEELEKRNVNEP